MFDGIYLEDFVTDEIVRAGQHSALDDNDALKNYGDIDQISKISDHADYVIQGTGKFLLPVYLNPDLKTGLNYLETFGYLYAGKQYYTKRTSLASYLIIYTYSGQGILVFEGKKYELMPDSLVWIDCRIPHEYYTCGDYWEHSTIHFDGVNTKSYYGQFIADGCPLIGHADRDAFQFDLEALLKCIQRPAVGSEMEASILLETLLFHIIRQKLTTTSALPEYIAYLRRYIDAHISHDFTLDELAEFSSLSKYHLAREFKKYIGYSVNDYIIQLRLSRAGYYLKHTDIPISRISDLVGFRNYSNFYKLFEKKYHQSPREYKKDCL